MKKKRPNIIIFNPDQWRGDVMGHLGNPAAVTPNLDAIVETEAVSFRNTFVQNPVCTPSRCSFMSGWYPHVRGHRTMFHMMQPDEPVLLQDLKDLGYYVWWGGKNDLVPAQNGFEAYCNEKYVPTDTAERPLRKDFHAGDEWRGDPEGDNFYSFYHGKIENKTEEKYVRDGDWAMVEGALSFIQNAPKDQPFCIYLPLLFPHPPFGVEDPWYSQIDREKIPTRIPTPENWDNLPSLLKAIFDRQKMQEWDEERFTELIATYYGMCAQVDAQFGQVVAALKDAGSYDDTAIFFFSDHGEFAGNYGLVEKTQNTFQDSLTNVPFIVKPPLKTAIKPGVRDALVELVDFRATVDDLIDFKPDYTHFGRSLLPIIAGETTEHRAAVFCEGGRLQDEFHAMELESSSHQSPQGLYWPRVGMQSTAGPEHSKAVMCRTQTHKYVRRLYEKDELYDLIDDPQELNNLIGDPAYAEIQMKLKDRLLTFFLETGDVVKHQTDQR
jgi:arylsulfatase A-like enzyme